MNRPIVYDQSDVRSYDHLSGWRQALYATSSLVAAVFGSTSTVVSGLAATPTGPASLTINLASGQIYELASVDATAYGDLTSDLTQVLQQGFAAAQTVTLTTSGLSAGQSRWALVQATFSQVDDIPSDDPNGGLLPFLNTSDPSGPPWSGPGNSGSTLNTRRRGVCTISVIYGSVATTGSEVPPNPSASSVGLYLIDLAFGQTTVTSGNIKVAGPSIGTGVPSNYPYAPFVKGLLNGHHSGTAGQAAQIDLTKEVQNQLPFANMPNGTWGGNYTSLSFQSAAYTTQATDFGTVVELAAAAAGATTFKVIDGTFVGACLNFVNQSSFNLTIQVNTGSAAEFIGVGVALATSFVIPAGGNAEIIWGGVNWRVNNFSGAYAGVGTIGSLAGLSFQAANYTTQLSDTGTIVELAGTATGPATFKVIDGTFNGAQVQFVNQSNFALTIQINTGSSAEFIGIGVPLGTSFVIASGGGATIVWGGVNWRVSAFFGNFSSSGTLTATSGYEIHSDGTIEQWGTGTLSAGTATVTWPIAFPTGAYRASFIANTTATAVSAAGPTFAQSNSVSTTGGTVWGATGATNTFSYRVKGY